MNKDRKSLGFFPVGSEPIEDLDLSFIPDINHKKRNGDDDHSNDESVPNKKTVSYYFEESLANKLRKLADENEQTYSSVAREAIRSYLSRKGYS